MEDAVIVGAGPNGLTAAVLLAQAGLSVLIIEGADHIGGGTSTEALTLDGFIHDVCSAVHPLAKASPILSSLPLGAHGLEWVDPPIALAHPFDDEPPALYRRNIDATADGLGADAEAYKDLLEPFTTHWRELRNEVLAPLHVPKHPLLLARFGLHGAQSANRLLRHHFKTERAQAMLGGIASHALQPLTQRGGAAIALVLAAAGHNVNWPFARGGSHAIAHALASYFTSLGGRIETGRPVRQASDIPAARTTLLDLTPRQVLRLYESELPHGYAKALRRFRYGPGVFKVDWALADPVPWRWPDCADAGTVHLAGSFDSLVADEEAVARGEHPAQPLVLLAQPSRFDRTRAPAGQHTLWGYCHVPHGSTVNMLPRIEAQIERFAPGFGERVLARHVFNTAQLEARNPNLVGGDIGAGANTFRQLFFRPVIRANPYATPVKGLYLCSASTPPGGGVHGMCGYYAARSALRDIFGLRTTELAA